MDKIRLILKLNGREVTDTNKALCKLKLILTKYNTVKEGWSDELTRAGVQTGQGHSESDKLR